MMRYFIQIMLAATALIWATTITSAVDCKKAAEKLAQSENAIKILSVEAQDEECQVKLLVPDADEKPPRVVSKTVSE